MENRFLTTFGITECRNLNAVIAVCRRFLTSFGITTFYVYYSERNPKNNLYFRFI